MAGQLQTDGDINWLIKLQYLYLVLIKIRDRLSF